MRRPVLPVLLAAALPLAACVDQPAPAEPEEFVIPLYDHGGIHPQNNFRARMYGTNENPANASNATGVVSVGIRGDSLYFRITAKRIDDITQAHIHLGSPTQNGGVVAWLYPDGPPATLIPGAWTGVLNEGYINDGEVVGVLAGQGVAGLIPHLRSGNAYANLHTSAFPGGEIRAQLD